jgi:hypothetical protein
MAQSRTIFLASLGIIALQVGLISEASAQAELSLSSGTSSVLITDNAMGDIDPQIGSIQFNGSVGAFTGTFGLGTTKPLNGSATQPQLTFSSRSLRTSAEGGTLSILFGDTNFGAVSNGAVSAKIGGATSNLPAQPGSTPVTSTGEVSYLTFMDASNAPLGTTTALTTQGPFAGTFLDNVSGNVTFGLNTSLTQEILVTQGPNAITVLNSSLRITSPLATPDSGAAITLFAVALLALEGCRRRLHAAS